MKSVSPPNVRPLSPDPRLYVGVRRSAFSWRETLGFSLSPPYNPQDRSFGAYSVLVEGRQPPRVERNEVVVSPSFPSVSEDDYELQSLTANQFLRQVGASLPPFSLLEIKHCLRRP